MKYLELKPIEIEVPEGRYIHDYAVWNNAPSGCYIVKEGVHNTLAIVNAENRFVNLMPMPELCIIDTKPVIEDSLVNELHKQIGNLVSEVHLLTLMKPQQSATGGLDGDTIMKLLAVAQKPDLAKDL